MKKSTLMILKARLKDKHQSEKFVAAQVKHQKSIKQELDAAVIKHIIDDGLMYRDDAMFGVSIYPEEQDRVGHICLHSYDSMPHLESFKEMLGEKEFKYENTHFSIERHGNTTSVTFFNPYSFLHHAERLGLRMQHNSYIKYVRSKMDEAIKSQESRLDRNKVRRKIVDQIAIHPEDENFAYNPLTQSGPKLDSPDDDLIRFITD